MIHILLVDDERMARESIQKTLLCAAPGEVRVSLACHGLDGLEQALRETPDILITDVRMPRMDGLELAERVRALFPQCKLIFLSNYADKHYLKTAIRLGAVSYVEKSALEEELLAALRPLIEELQSAPRRDATRDALDAAVGEVRAFLKVLWARAISRESADLASLGERCRLYGLAGLEGMKYRCILIGSGASSALPEALAGEPDVLSYLREDDAKVAYLCAMEDCALSDARIESLFGACHDEHAFWAVGTVAARCADAHQSYTTAALAFERHFWQYDDSLLFYRDEPRAPAEEVGEALSGEIVRALYALDSPRARAALEALLRHFRLHANNVVGVKNYYCGVIDSMLAFSREIHLNFHASHSSGELYDIVWSTATLWELNKLALRLTSELLSFECSDERVARLITAYIQNNYADPALSLDALCKYSGYSISRICPLFKRALGMTINQYTQAVRINHAKRRLLSGNETLEEIARAVGFGSTNYFCKRFKQMTGVTPKEFRSQ